MMNWRISYGSGLCPQWCDTSDDGQKKKKNYQNEAGMKSSTNLDDFRPKAWETKIFVLLITRRAKWNRLSQTAGSLSTPQIPQPIHTNTKMQHLWNWLVHVVVVDDDDDVVVVVVSHYQLNAMIPWCNFWHISHPGLKPATSTCLTTRQCLRPVVGLCCVQNKNIRFKLVLR